MEMKLPEDDRHFVFGGVPMLANRLQVAGTEATGDITFKQWLAMLVVRDMPAGSSVSDIAKQHGSTRQNVKKLLDGLSKMGYVELSGDEEDRRSYAVFMTQKGKTCMAEISKTGEEFLDAAFEGADPKDIAAARRVIMQMLHNLDSILQQGRQV